MSAPCPPSLSPRCSPIPLPSPTSFSKCVPVSLPHPSLSLYVSVFLSLPSSSSPLPPMRVLLPTSRPCTQHSVPSRSHSVLFLELTRTNVSRVPGWSLRRDSTGVSGHPFTRSRLKTVLSPSTWVRLPMWQGADGQQRFP